MFHLRFRRLQLFSGLVFAFSFCLSPSVTQEGFASGANESLRSAPKPLYRDPVHDGAADPSLIWDRGWCELRSKQLGRSVRVSFLAPYLSFPSP